MNELETRSLEWCPGCGSWNLVPVVGDDVTNVLCRECGSCWHPDADGVHRVDPRLCPGCVARPICLRRLWQSLP